MKLMQVISAEKEICFIEYLTLPNLVGEATLVVNE